MTSNWALTHNLRGFKADIWIIAKFKAAAVYKPNLLVINFTGSTQRGGGGGVPL